MNLTTYLRAGHPGLAVISSEEARAEELSHRLKRTECLHGDGSAAETLLKAGVLNVDIADQILPVNQDRARDNALALARNEGLFVGVSSGATLTAGLDVAASAAEGSVILVMLPDTGERYLSTFMFEGINEGSDDDWLATL